VFPRRELMTNVTVRYWAAAKQAAGVAEETLDADTLAEAIAAVLARRGHDPRLRAVLDRSSFLVDGSAVGRGGAEEVVLPEAAVIEVLPPFAGG
jgi:sulfur-carrier protein